MKFKLRCKCGASCWHQGEDEPDVNTVALNDDISMEWEGGDDQCNHEDFAIIDSETDEPEPDYGEMVK